MVAVSDYVASRPAPGPVTWPAPLVGGPHRRDPDDPRLCVCGDVWVQSMTCHPCRMGDHPPEWCVDGPAQRVVDERGGVSWVYPARSAGRWCMCGHHPTGAEPVPATPRLPAGELAVDTPAPYLRPALEGAFERLGEIVGAEQARAAFTAAAVTRGFARGLARQRHLLGSPAIEGLYTLEPPEGVAPAPAYCGDAPAAE